MKKIILYQFLSSDNNYTPFVATTMASILDNTKSFIEFYVLDGGISEENQEKIRSLKNQFSNFSIEFLKINIDKVFSKIAYSSTQDYISISTLIYQMANRYINSDALYKDLILFTFGKVPRKQLIKRSIKKKYE